MSRAPSNVYIKTTCKSKVGPFSHRLSPPSPSVSVLLSPSTGHPSRPLICSPGCSTVSRLAPCRQSRAEAARICPRTSSSHAFCLWMDGTMKKRGKIEEPRISIQLVLHSLQTAAQCRQTSLTQLQLCVSAGLTTLAHFIKTD